MKNLFSLTFALLCAPTFADTIAIQEIASPYKSSTLYVPNDGKPHPGVVVLHGSEGGSLPYMNLEAQYLAAHGFAALAFCWYNCGKSMITSPIEPLENIELAKTIDAIAWFKNSDYVKGKKVALTGFSRGAEQAVLLGSIEKAAALVDVIAVHTPADKIVVGFYWPAEDQRCWICSTFDLKCFNSSVDPNDWSWNDMRWNMSCGPTPGNSQTMKAWLLNGVALPLHRDIAIEKFKKPVFITVGDQDELWDYKQCVRLKDRLEAAGQPIELHIFPGEHHNFSLKNENVRRQLLLDFLNTNIKTMTGRGSI
jgi:dienelactone hydrolase